MTTRTLNWIFSKFLRGKKIRKFDQKKALFFSFLMWYSLCVNGRSFSPENWEFVRGKSH